MLRGVFFLFVKSTIDPNSATMTARAIAPTAPKLPNAGTELVWEVIEDNRVVMEVGRTMVVAVVLERLLVLLGLNVLDRVGVPLIKLVDAGKLSSTVA